MVMKLGILTFHCAHNYGALLQCYALQEYLHSLGHEVFVIDYRPWYLVRDYQRSSFRYWISRTPISTMKKFISELKLHKIRAKRFDNFDRFISHNLNIAPYHPSMDFSEYDAIFIGSDQVWNKDFNGGEYDPVYFGVNAKCSIIPYAASNKLSTLSEKDATFFKNQLPRFSAIGVREKRLQELLQPLTSTPIVHTVDPTLLAGSILTDNIKDDRIVQDKYVFVYEIVEHVEVLKTAKEYAKLHGYKVVMLSAYLQTKNCDIRDQEASPTDFVNYIRHAECVFTTSFHGTALSIIMRKNFYSFRQHTNSDIRIESILNTLGLQDRFVEMNTSVDGNQIDYSTVYQKLGKNVESSREFIDKALSDIHTNKTKQNDSNVTNSMLQC